MDGDANDVELRPAMLSQTGIADRVVDQMIPSYHWFTLCVSLDTALKSG